MPSLAIYSMDPCCLKTANCLRDHLPASNTTPDVNKVHAFAIYIYQTVLMWVQKIAPMTPWKPNTLVNACLIVLRSLRESGNLTYSFLWSMRLLVTMCRCTDTSLGYPGHTAQSVLERPLCVELKSSSEPCRDGGRANGGKCSLCLHSLAVIPRQPIVTGRASGYPLSVGMAKGSESE